MRLLVPGLTSVIFSAGLLQAAVTAEGSFDKTLSVSDAVELDAQTDSGGILITAGRSGSLHVHAILKAQRGWFDSGEAEQRIRELERNPPVEQTGNRVRIGYVSDRSLLRNISMRLEIETPAGTQVRAHADSGGIRVRGVRKVDCKTDSGGMEINDIAGDVRAEADSGGIHVRNVQGSLFARVDSGGIDATDVAGSMDVEADSGHIGLVQTKPGPIRAKADSGGIHVSLAPGAGYDLTAEASSGGISVPEMTVKSSFSRHHVEGKIRGGGPLVSIHVDSGGIKVD